MSRGPAQDDCGNRLALAAPPGRFGIDTCQNRDCALQVRHEVAAVDRLMVGSSVAEVQQLLEVALHPMSVLVGRRICPRKRVTEVWHPQGRVVPAADQVAPESKVELGHDMAQLAATLGSVHPIFAGHSAGGLSAFLAAADTPAALGVLGLDPVDASDAGSSAASDIDGPAYAILGESSALAEVLLELLFVVLEQIVLVDVGLVAEAAAAASMFHS